MPTRARRERAGLLWRAIDSVLTQERVRAAPIVVVNGLGRDHDLVDALRRDERLTVLSRDEAGLPAALAAGREAVDAPWFTDLDDDDLLMPGALALRVQALEEATDCCAVVTNGIVRDGDRDRPKVPADVDVAADPVRAMLRGNWLLPGSYLCRSDALGVELFRDMPSYLERTYLALRLATTGPILWVPEPTVIYHAHTPNSTWKSRACVLGQADALRGVLRLPLPDDVRQHYRRQITRACHATSEMELEAGRLREAWRWHLRSLREPRGWEWYRSFTASLLRSTLSG